MEFRTKPHCFQLNKVAVSMKSAMRVSKGDPNLAITATQFTLGINLSTNRLPMEFQVVENMLRSLLAGKVWSDLNVDAYMQEESSFTVRFAPPSLSGSNQSDRRELQAIEIDSDFAYLSNHDERAFPEILASADYTVKCAMVSLGNLAPAVFNANRCAKLCLLQPLMRPLKIGLKLDPNSRILDEVVERQLLYMPEKKPKKASSSSSQKMLTSHPFAHQGILRWQRSTRTFYPSIETKPLESKSLELAQSESSESRKGSCSVLNNEPWIEVGEIFGLVEFTRRRFVVLCEDGENVHEPYFLPRSLRL